MSVRDSQTSSKQWNIPMLNAIKYVQDNDTQGKVSSQLRDDQVAKDM